MTRRSRYDSEFGNSVSSALTAAKLTQNDLAGNIGVSPSYLNQIMTGRKVAPPKWVEFVAAALKMQDEQRKLLHKAAAKDAGYDVLDLSKA